MNTSTLTVSDLEELLDAEIPCEGINIPAIRRSCSNAAMLVSRAHGCKSRYKCVSCWQDWYRSNMEYLMKVGYFGCIYCHQTFYTIEDLSDYRPL